MPRIAVTLLTALIAVTHAAPVGAQVFDHLQCFEMRDFALPAEYRAELLPEQAPPFSVMPGCKVRVPAKYFCVDTEKRNLRPPAPLVVGGDDARDYLCYRVHCPGGSVLPDMPIQVEDQFGERSLLIRRPRMLCAPANKVGSESGPTSTPTPGPGVPTPTQTAGSGVPTPTATPSPGARFIDNGDGTVTDNQTGLQWEKKNNDDSTSNPDLANPHDVNNVYKWGNLSGCPFTGCPNGAAFTDFLGRLNNCGFSNPNAGFAGHCDWRLPTVEELQTLCASGQPLDPIFGPTAADLYWSVATSEAEPRIAVSVGAAPFNCGAFDTNTFKSENHYVRAVRGGS